MFPRLRTLALFLSTLAVFSTFSASPAAAEDAKNEPMAHSPVLRVKGYLPAAERAQAELGRSYAGLLERRKFGFDQGLNESVRSDISKLRAEFSNADAGGKAGMLAPPLASLAIFLFLLALLDRHAVRIAHLRHASVDASTNTWLNRARRSGTVALGRMAPIAVLIPLTYFPLQAVFGRAAWTVAFTELAWLFLAFRGAHAALLGAFAFRLFSVSDRTAQQLLLFGLWTLRVVFVWLAAITIAYAVDYRESFSALLAFLLNSSLVILACGMLALRNEFVELLTHEESGRDRRLANVAERYYYPAIILTIALLTLAAIGYVDAASFVLLRGYGAIIVLFGSQRAASWSRHRIQIMRADARSQDEADLYGSIGVMTRGASVVLFIWLILEAFHLLGPIVTVIGIPLFVFGSTSISPLAVIESILLVASAVLLGKFLRALMLTRIFPLFGVEIGVGYAINTLVNYAVIVIGVVVATAALGVDLSSLTVLMASLGVGIGLGLQNLTENLISGFILLFGRSVKKGDVVTVNDVYGRIDAVGARSVIIKTPDNFDMLIPSRQLVTGQVINWSYRDTFVRLHLPVGVTYNANPRVVQRVLLRAVARHPRVIDDPAPEVWLVGFGDSSVNFEVLVYFDISRITMDRLRGQLNFIVWDALAEAEIEIPFPQQDVHIRSGEFFPELKGALERHGRVDGGEAGHEHIEAGEEPGPSEGEEAPSSQKE